jgi:tetratricopeptide (TPR) repeat protein
MAPRVGRSELECKRRRAPRRGRGWARSGARIGAWALGSVCFALSGGVSVGIAHAQSASSTVDPGSSEYDRAIARAVTAFDEQRYEQARSLFEQAHALSPSARTLRGLGATAFALNRYAQARGELDAALSDVRRPLTAEQRREVRDILSWMQANLGTLQLQLSPSYALASVDEHPVSKGANLLEPGQHRLHVEATDYASHDQNFAIARDKTLELHVTLSAPPSTPVAASVAPTTVAARTTAPLVATTEPARETQRRDGETTSVFERWWFWTLAAAVVGASAIVIVGVAHDPAPRALPSGIRIGTM